MSSPKPEPTTAAVDNLPAVITAPLAVTTIEEIRQNMIPVAAVKEMIAWVDTVRAEIMKPNVHFGIIPGTDKPSLYQSGAELLCLGFQLEQDADIVDETHNPDQSWEYQVRIETKGDKGEKVIAFETKKAKGYHRYVVKCVTRTRSGIKICETLGECDSMERGREFAPGHTILMMAQKRATIYGARKATASSDRFTSDLEDFPAEIRDQMMKRKENRPASSKQIAFLERLAKSNKVPQNLKDAAAKFLTSDDRNSDGASELIELLKKATEGEGSASNGQPPQDNATAKPSGTTAGNTRGAGTAKPAAAKTTGPSAVPADDGEISAEKHDIIMKIKEHEAALMTRNICDQEGLKQARMSACGTLKLSQATKGGLMQLCENYETTLNA